MAGNHKGKLSCFFKLKVSDLKGQTVYEIGNISHDHLFTSKCGSGQGGVKPQKYYFLFTEIYRTEAWPLTGNLHIDKLNMYILA